MKLSSICAAACLAAALGCGSGSDGMPADGGQTGGSGGSAGAGGGNHMSTDGLTGTGGTTGAGGGSHASAAASGISTGP